MLDVGGLIVVCSCHDSYWDVMMSYCGEITEKKSSKLHRSIIWIN